MKWMLLLFMCKCINVHVPWLSMCSHFGCLHFQSPSSDNNGHCNLHKNCRPVLLMAKTCPSSRLLNLTSSKLMTVDRYVHVMCICTCVLTLRLCFMCICIYYDSVNFGTLWCGMFLRTLSYCVYTLLSYCCTCFAIGWVCHSVHCQLCSQPVCYTLLPLPPGC